MAALTQTQHWNGHQGGSYEVVIHQTLEPGRVLRSQIAGSEILIYALEGVVRIKTEDRSQAISIQNPYSIKGVSPYVIYNAGMQPARVLIIRRCHLEEPTFGIGA
jgi:hypothetical protein